MWERELDELSVVPCSSQVLSGGPDVDWLLQMEIQTTPIYTLYELNP
jgi:hypothetical protein